ncbi:GNAT family N-acetyltransferase [Methylocapsa palsarum]|uniref:Ribosomal-protein-alanine acetyltransferase n=1 Tax=Methylocapsa palsarum TaxID=1612308 RepID=A0A1I4A8J5_9HYPH|nr:GNAT family N-acetyltransferase [Methylocapsa palsarum]SFK52116.1 ribosomal-protein-alanine acetyltransferase [Methylocapsa palsarum]
MARQLGAGTQAAAVRPARIEDLDAIEAIENKVFDGDRLSRRSLRYFLTAKTAILLALDSGGRIAGYSLIGFRKNSFRGRLYSIALDPSAHGRGLGRQLLHSSERAAKARGAMTMRLEVRTDNSRAIRLYEQSGYCRFAIIDDYYEDGASALRLEKVLRA